MTASPERSLIWRMPAGSRPSPIGLMSTSVPIPLATPSRASSVERSTSVNACPGMPGESIRRRSCGATRPRVALGGGPVTVMTRPSGTRASSDARCRPGSTLKVYRRRRRRTRDLTVEPYSARPIVSLTARGWPTIVDGAAAPSMRSWMPVAEPADRRRPRRRLRAALLLCASLLLALLPVASNVDAATTWSRNLYVAKAFLYQDPYYTACTAASAMHMLNTVAYRRTGGNGFVWRPTRIRKDADPSNTRDMTSILAFSRRYDTLRSTSAGSDAHGWRNALNYYGWGRAAMTDPALRVYDDRAYRSYASAMKAAVRAIARHGMPVGVLAWAGGHAQVVTGYVVTGANPATSSDFTIQWLYLSDPLRKSEIVDRKTSYGAMQDGPLRMRFQSYRETDSPYDDPYTDGWMRSSVKTTVGTSEWFHRWVLLLPIRSGLPNAPDPTPTPTPTPTPDPTPSTDPTPPPDPTPSPSDAPAKATTSPAAT